MKTRSPTALNDERPDATPWRGPLTTTDAAQMLGVSERTIRRAIRRGDLEADKRRGRIYITKEALDQYLLQREQTSGPSRRLLILVPTPEPPSVVPFTTMRRSRLALLPAPLTRFIGRESEMAAVKALLQRDDVRLVTLSGPGGVGKTRLALQVAEDLTPSFADGAAFVPLAPVRSPDLVLVTIALTLGVRDGDDKPPFERVVHFLHDREVLLVLDNFEHLMEAGPLAAELLKACSRLTILATSRAALHLSGERIFALPPLALPEQPSLDRGWAPAPEELAAVEAVRLFVDRAEAAAGGFVLNAENAAAVAAICVRADGLPLAIELAAARTALLSPVALLARLEPRLPLLSGGPRDQPDRLRTMHDAIAWSHDLLPTEERACFQRLAVFVGGCTIEGAEAVQRVNGRLGREATSVLDLVQRLVDQAVLQRNVDEAEQPRFGMLETIREYGLEQLAANGQEDEARDAHARWYLALAEMAEPELAGPNQSIWVRRLEADMGNIRAALDWHALQGDAESALRLAGAIGWLWSTAPYLEESRARFDAILAMPGVEQYPVALAKALAMSGDVADWQGDQVRARAEFERALAIYRELDDRWRMVSMLRGLGSSAIDRGEFDLALTLLEESLSLAREVGHEWETAASTNLIGTTYSALGNFSGALERHQQAAATWRELEDTGHVITALASAAWVALLSGEPGHAAAAYRETLELASEGEDEWYVTWSVIGAGALAAARSEPRRAAELLGTGLENRERLGVPLRPHVSATLDQIIASLRKRLNKSEFATAWKEGRSKPIDAATAQAFDVFDAAIGDGTTPFSLTRRERDVLRLLVEGRSDKEIATTLFVARATASHHVAAILAKLGADSRTAAVAIALRHELT